MFAAALMQPLLLTDALPLHDPHGRQSQKDEVENYGTMKAWMNECGEQGGLLSM